jgi:hypothetical protein
MNVLPMIADAQKRATNILAFRIEPAGYGATISRLMTGLNLAIQHNATMKFGVDSNYVIEGLFDLRLLQNTNRQEKTIAWDFFKDTWDHPSRNQTIYPFCPFNTELDKDAWAANLAYALLGRPTAVLRAHIADQKSYLKWDSYDVRIGLHIRRGDKTIEHPHVPISVYMKFLTEELKRHEGKRVGVYLSSDDPNAYRELSLPVDILWDDREKRYNNSNIGMVRSQPDLAIQESITAARIICMFGDCDAVIGLQNTQFTWIGGLLMLYKNGFNKERHIMIDPRTSERGHWGAMYTMGAR